MELTLEEIVAGIHPLDGKAIAEAQAHTAQLVMPPRALGRLHDVGERLCGIQGRLDPVVRGRAILVMAGDHGVVDEGVSAFPQSVTGAMIATFLAGGAGINALARQAGAEVWVADVGVIPDIDPAALKNRDRFLVRKVARGTRNFARGPAMTREEARSAVMAGFDVASRLIALGVDVIGTGDMGIGNTTPSAAIGAVLTGRSVEEMTGRGTGIDDPGLNRKRDVIRRGIELNRPEARSGLDVLAKVGGFEIGGIAGIVLAGAYHRKAVVIDGFISTAGALIAHAICPHAIDYVFAGHCSEEPGHRHMLAHLNLRPLLDLGMRLGEGTGAALAMILLDAAVRVMTEVMTFAQAQVPGKEG
jgi:nicotinate-nucleotide--dimethylbenzimidazole phosphoribosyltransferase